MHYEVTKYIKRLLLRCIHHFISQWRSSTPKSGGAQTFFPKSEKQKKKKKKKKGHSGVKAQDRVLWIGKGL